MPDTPGKRQRREVKARKRQAQDERRRARTDRKNDPTLGPLEWADHVAEGPDAEFPDEAVEPSPEP